MHVNVIDCNYDTNCGHEWLCLWLWLWLCLWLSGCNRPRDCARVLQSCCYCGKPGATGLCMSMKCKKHYHPSCAVRSNGLLQFFGQFKWVPQGYNAAVPKFPAQFFWGSWFKRGTFSGRQVARQSRVSDWIENYGVPPTAVYHHCNTGRRVQIVLRGPPSASERDRPGAGGDVRHLSGEGPTPEDDHHVLWTPCCRHFFHRACLQVLCLTAGGGGEGEITGLADVGGGQLSFL